MKNESDSLKLIRLSAQVEIMRRELRHAKDACAFLVAMLLLTIMVISVAIWSEGLVGGLI